MTRNWKVVERYFWKRNVKMPSSGCTTYQSAVYWFQIKGGRRNRQVNIDWPRLCERHLAYNAKKGRGRIATERSENVKSISIHFFPQQYSREMNVIKRKEKIQGGQKYLKLFTFQWRKITCSVMILTYKSCQCVHFVQKLRGFKSVFRPCFQIN